MRAADWQQDWSEQEIDLLHLSTNCRIRQKGRPSQAHTGLLLMRDKKRDSKSHSKFLLNPPHSPFSPKLTTGQGNILYSIYREAWQEQRWVILLHGREQLIGHNNSIYYRTLYNMPYPSPTIWSDHEKFTDNSTKFVHFPGPYTSNPGPTDWIWPAIKHKV